MAKIGFMWPVIMRSHKGAGQSCQELICIACQTGRVATSFLESSVKRIITTRSSVSKCKMPKVHMQRSRTCPMGRDPFFGDSWNDSLTETTQLELGPG